MPFNVSCRFFTFILVFCLRRTSLCLVISVDSCSIWLLFRYWVYSPNFSPVRFTGICFVLNSEDHSSWQGSLLHFIATFCILVIPLSPCSFRFSDSDNPVHLVLNSFTNPCSYFHPAYNFITLSFLIILFWLWHIYPTVTVVDITIDTRYIPVNMIGF
jgi:hypothetical protein